MKALHEQVDAKVANAQRWAAGPSLQRFTTLAEKTLNGRVKMQRGIAWDQLQRAHATSGKAKATPSNERASQIARDPFDTSDGMGDTNVVDGRP